ncbi:hypothetical protein [Leptospira sp. GIMC2001]|uniref:hypothetical protein n=1 Tax=Leptospira sp. GIMC2001 TaxID=1513297 RepID=UPI00234BC1B5|nr:hypothetical protein [Leptospira sp. GIMC2001]WCL48844.1 hypothetical protein O4O04_16280 [Leptospira sp. GIMC2001]
MMEYKRKTFRFFQLALIFFVASVFLNPINPRFQSIQVDNAESCEINFESETKSDSNCESNVLFSVWIPRNDDHNLHSINQILQPQSFTCSLLSDPLYLPIPPPIV